LTQSVTETRTGSKVGEAWQLVLKEKKWSVIVGVTGEYEV